MTNEMASSFQGFRSLIEHSPDAISMIDSDGEILYASAATFKMFGYQPEELVGRNCLELIHPEDLGHSSQALREVLAKPSHPLRWDSRIRDKGGNYSWVESTISNLLFESDVQAIFVHQRDINAQRVAELQRQQQAEELARCIARLEEFTYTAAHDLQEPLRAISSYTEMLVQEAPLDGNSTKMANFVIDAAARMTAVIDDLLCFASTGVQEQRRPVDLTRAVAQATQNLALSIKESGAGMMIGPLPIVYGNEIHLVRLFQNLIGNAVKYRGKESPKIHVTAEQVGPDWVIRIADNGLGIAAKNKARVFMPFVRLANRDVPGTGLGLAVCKKIVEGLGGTIEVESELGVGSTFCLTLLAAEDGIEAPEIDGRKGDGLAWAVSR
jgi:PAS domain S-box-containing protein